jgi:hypothetical protein
MNTNEILTGWEDYDNKKKKGQDANFFSCTEEWEVEYLIKKIKASNPKIERSTIKAAIQSCCRTVKAPRPRKAFVNCVMLILQ